MMHLTIAAKINHFYCQFRRESRKTQPIIHMIIT